MTTAETGLLLIAAAIVAFTLAATLIENLFLRRRMDELNRTLLYSQAGSPRVPVSLITETRDAIAASFPPQFVRQFQPEDFAHLVEERLRTQLQFAFLYIGRNGPSFTEYP